MDFWDLFFDSDFKQRADIEALKRSEHARRVSRRHKLRQVEDMEQRIEQLEDQVGELALLCRTLLTVMREDGSIAPERFQEVMIRIDAEDGVVDGKVTPPKPPNDPPDAPEIHAW